MSSNSENVVASPSVDADNMASSDTVHSEDSNLGKGTLLANADFLIQEMKEISTFFHNAKGEGYAKVNENGQTFRIQSDMYRKFLEYQYFKAKQSAVSLSDVKKARNALEAHALFECPQEEVFTRVGMDANAVYVDLCNDDWEAVEITRDDWRIIQNPPVNFIRKPGMKALPHPQRETSLLRLKEIIHFPSENAFRLFVGWLVNALHISREYLILMVQGEQGCSKSSLTEIAHTIIDPSESILRALPKTERNLAVATSNSYVRSFDNVSKISPELSDMLCRISTGGGLSTRKVFTDDTEVNFNKTIPIIINGIEIVVRPDLADRAISLNLTPISKYSSSKVK